MKNFYFPKCDFIITTIFTLVLLISGGITLSNDAFWVYIIYIVSLGFTNLNKMSIKRIDSKTTNKRKRFEKKHINNPRSNKKILPRELKEIDNSFNYDTCFTAIKFVLGMIVVVFLAIITSVGHKQGTEFGGFVFYFYIDAFLLPLILILEESFMYNNSALKAIKEFLYIAFHKNKKLTIIRGIIGLIGSIFLLSIALIFTMKEFVTTQYSIAVRIIIFICGLLFLIYSFYNASNQD